MRRRWVWAALTMLVVLLSACGGSEDTGPTTEAPAIEQVKEEVTLRFMMSGSQDNFDIKFGSNPLIKEQLPHITLEYSHINDWDNLITAGIVPDMVNLVPANFYRIADNGLVFDHTDLLKKYNLDPSRFTPEYLELARQMSDPGKLYAIPDKMDFPYSAFALVYNKDIFDRFGQDYPRDGMSWDEVIALAQRMNRSDGAGGEYKGLALVNAGNMLRTQLNLGFLNEAGRVDLSGPAWATLLQIVKGAAEVQNNWNGVPNGNVNLFIRDHNIAMLAGVINNILLQAPDLEGSLNWDMATLPHIPGQPLTLPGSSGFYVVTSRSEHKDAVMEVLKVVLEENSDLANFENPAAMRRNLDAIRNQEVNLPVPSRYETVLNQMLQRKLLEMVEQQKDVNTVLRELQEEMQLRVDQENAK